MRSKGDAERFVAGMKSFASKAEVVCLLDDDRNFGAKRIKEAISFIEDEHGVNEILVPIIACVINQEINRPLYKRVRNRIVAILNSVPGLFSLISEPDILEMVPAYSAEVVCSLLEVSVLTLVEARNSSDIRTLAKELSAKGVQAADKVCTLLLIVDEKTRPTTQQTKDGDSDAVACWVSDRVQPGGRHDNDFENFRDIQLVPTHEEISCETPQWLPLASQENAFIENKEMRLLDANFRLLREDAVSTMKSNIEEARKVWTNARIIGLNCGYEEGKRGPQPLSFLVQLDSTYTKKNINWERSRALPHEGVIALCSSADRKVQRLGTITERNNKVQGKWLQAAGGPIIGVVFHNSEDILSSVHEAVANMAILARSGYEDNPSKHKDGTTEVEASHAEAERTKRWREVQDSLVSYDLIEASGSFFSYRPILSALQEFSDVPLARELVHLESSAPRPDYIPSNVVMPQTESFNGFVCDLDNWSSEKLVSSTSLDKSQADALHRALTSKVALIQGPPGEIGLID